MIRIGTDMHSDLKVERKQVGMSVVEYVTYKDGKVKVINHGIASAKKKWLRHDYVDSCLFWACGGAIGGAIYHLVVNGFTLKRFVLWTAWIIFWLIIKMISSRQLRKLKKDYKDEIDLELGLQVNADHGDKRP